MFDPTRACDDSRLPCFFTSTTCTNIWQSFKKDRPLTEDKSPRKQRGKEEGKKRANSVAPGRAMGFAQLQSSTTSHLPVNRKANCLLWKSNMVKMEPVLYVEFCDNAQKFLSRGFLIFFFPKDLLKTQCAEYKMRIQWVVVKGNPYQQDRE